MFIHSSIDEYLGCFHLWIIMQSAAMNTGVQVAVSAFNSLVYTPRSGVARSMVIEPLTVWGNSILQQKYFHRTNAVSIMVVKLNFK